MYKFSFTTATYSVIFNCTVYVYKPTILRLLCVAFVNAGDSGGQDYSTKFLNTTESAPRAGNPGQENHEQNNQRQNTQAKTHKRQARQRNMVTRKLNGPARTKWKRRQTYRHGADEHNKDRWDQGTKTELS